MKGKRLWEAVVISLVGSPRVGVVEVTPGWSSR